MDNRQLRHFLTIYEEGSITAAARRCFVAQPSLSASLNQLEKTLGVRLFTRHKGGVRPTPEGERLYPQAKRLVGELQALTALFRDAPSRQTLSIGLMPALDAARVGRCMQRLRDESPDIRLRLVDHTDEADARIISEPLLQPGETFHKLWEERYILALPHHDPLTLGSAVSLRDLDGHPLIHRCQCEMGEKAGDLLARRHISPDPVAQVQNEEWALELVARGIGAALIPEGCIGERRDLAVRPLADAEITRKVGLGYPAEGTAGPRLAALMGSDAESGRP